MPVTTDTMKHIRPGTDMPPLDTPTPDDAPYPNPTTGIVIDLSRDELRRPFLEGEDISEVLPAMHEARMVDFVQSAGEMSYRRVQQRFSYWDEADAAYDVWVPPDATEFREKAVITDTRAIADTTLTYHMAALTGRNPMFQLEGFDRKSRKGATLMEMAMHQQMRRTAGEADIAQLLLDGLRYGYAPTKIGWDSDKNTNEIRNYDPRRVYTDPRCNWSDVDRMQFVIMTDFLSTDYARLGKRYPRLRTDLRDVQHYKAARRGWDIHNRLRKQGRGFFVDQTQPNAATASNQSYFSLGDARVVDEVYLRLAGYQVGLPGLDEVWVTVTILDEKHVIEFRLSPYGRQFPFVIGCNHYDAHKTYGQGTMDLLMPLHDIATWLLRSRVDNVQAALSNLIFADPSVVNIADLIDRNPWGVVQTLQGTKPGDGVHIAQIPDVTQGHWNDIAAINDKMQRTAAASDAQQGMPTGTVRTATEIARLSQMGSQRLGVQSRLISAMTIRPLVRMMVANTQDSLNSEGSIRMGANVPDAFRGRVDEGYLDYGIEELQGDIDYLVIDGTLPLEPTRNPETWMNILQVMQQTGLAAEFDVPAMAMELIRATGMTDIERFRLSPQRMQEGPSPSQKIMLMEKMRGASVQPQEQVQNQVGKGNLIPIQQAQAKGGRQ